MEKVRDKETVMTMVGMVRGLEMEKEMKWEKARG